MTSSKDWHLNSYLVPLTRSATSQLCLFGAHSALLTLLKHLANVFLAAGCECFSNAEPKNAISLLNLKQLNNCCLKIAESDRPIFFKKKLRLLQLLASQTGCTRFGIRTSLFLAATPDHWLGVMLGLVVLRIKIYEVITQPGYDMTNSSPWYRSMALIDS